MALTNMLAFYFTELFKSVKSSMILAPVKVISFYVILRKFNTMSLSQRIEFKLLKKDISEHACLSNKLERLNLTNSHGQVKYLDRQTSHSMMLYLSGLII
jgi:hypothetical protein